MKDSVEYRRLYWHSRRGMLELDLILVPFLEQRFASLSSEEQALYKRLLSAEDQDLFRWFLGAERPQDKELSRIVDLIREFSTQATPAN